MSTTPLIPDAADILNNFLRAQIPPFQAPTDVKAWKREVPRLRALAKKNVYLKGFPDKIVRAKPRVVWGETLRPDASYVIRKLRYEIYPDYWIPALLYEPAKLAKGSMVPVVLNPNGHHRGGKAADYKQTRCANIARRGMLALNMEYIGMCELEADCFHNSISLLDVTGLAGVGLFYLALQKGLDVLLSHKHADKSRCCVTGLSGGGWQTITISSMDERVTVSIPVAGYTAVKARIGCAADLGDMEQTPTDLCTAVDYDTMTAMLAPRPALLIFNEHDDCCFKTERARPVVYDAVRPTYDAFGAGEKFQTYSNHVPGTHNYGADNRSQFYKFLNKHFGLDTPETDIHRGDDELYPEDALNVGLPPTQATIARIGRERAVALMGKLKTPRSAADKRRLRKRLAEVIHLPSYEAKPAGAPAQADGAQQIRVEVGPWALPLAIEPKDDHESPILIVNDEGRTVPPPLPVQEPGTRYSLDLLGFGELKTGIYDLMVIQAVGHRLLGIQVAQFLAAARHLFEKHGRRKLHVVGDGWNVCFVVNVAMALEPALFTSFTNYGSMPTLRYIYDWGLQYEKVQSFMCFGLLEVADVPQLRALHEGIEYRQPGRGVVPDKR